MSSKLINKIHKDIIVLKNNSKSPEILKDKINHYKKVYKEWSNKNSELENFQNSLDIKEREFKTNNLLKVLKKTFDIEKRIQQVSDYLFDKNKIFLKNCRNYWLIQ
mgnify:CR=1 FL=1